MASICKTCEYPCDIGKACAACGYDPLSHREEQVVARIAARGDGQLRGSRNRMWILTTERVVFLKNGKRSNESKLAGIQEATFARRRNFAVLAGILACGAAAMISTASRLGGATSLISAAGILPFLAAWALWREPAITVTRHDDSSFVERLLPGNTTQAASFAEALQSQLKLRRK